MSQPFDHPARQPASASQPPARKHPRHKAAALIGTALCAPAILGLAACSVGSPTGNTQTVITPFGFYTHTETQVEVDNNTGQALAQALFLAAAIASKLEKVNQTCQALGAAEYRIDCLGEGYARTAADIPDNATFGDAKAAVTRAAAQLSGLASANRAPASLPDQAVPQAKRAVKPVDPAKLKAAQAAALKIIEETETVLLRSSDNKPSQSAAYEKIAAAVNSSKVLLRST